MGGGPGGGPPYIINGGMGCGGAPFCPLAENVPDFFPFLPPSIGIIIIGGGGIGPDGIGPLPPLGGP